MKLLQIVVLFQRSTITKEAHHRRYNELLDEISSGKPQQDLGAETTRNTNEDNSTQDHHVVHLILTDQHPPGPLDCVRLL